MPIDSIPIDYADCQDWLCPDLRSHWQLKYHPPSASYILQGIPYPQQFPFSAAESRALSGFTGQFTVKQLHQYCQAQLGTDLPPSFIPDLLQKLVQLGVLETLNAPPAASVEPPVDPPTPSLKLATGLQWIPHAEGYWILRSPEGKHHIQVSPDDKPIIEQIGQSPIAQLAQRHQCSPQYIHHLLSLLATAQMVEGITLPPPKAKKFTPLQLLYYKLPLLNPDAWLTRHIDKLCWVWTSMSWLALCSGLGLTGVVAIGHRLDLLTYGQALLTAYGWSLLLPFALLSMIVISLHELAHAFTLKHYGGAVTEMGLLFMCLMPSAYTDSSDAYCLSSRWQRCWVVAAGVICQIVIGAIAFWLWHLTAVSSGLHTTSYLLLVAALFTVALNLNPFAKFDGYHLAVAASGINNLKDRSFKLYANLIRQRPTQEYGTTAWLLAIYAPLSFVYVVLVFGHLALWLGNLVLTYVPYLGLVLVILWLIYFTYPQKAS